MTISLALFIVFGALAVLAAMTVVTTDNVVHSALALIAAAGAVAGIFFLLYADFLGLVQILIYGGAVAMLLLFALMLTRAGSGTAPVLDNRQWPWAAAVGAIFPIIVVGLTFTSGFPGQQTDLQRVGIQQIGRTLFLQWVVPFELVGLVLLVALVGAIVIARQEE